MFEFPGKRRFLQSWTYRTAASLTWALKTFLMKTMRSMINCSRMQCPCFIVFYSRRLVSGMLWNILWKRIMRGISIWSKCKTLFSCRIGQNKFVWFSHQNISLSESALWILPFQNAESLSQYVFNFFNMQIQLTFRLDRALKKLSYAVQFTCRLALECLRQLGKNLHPIPYLVSFPILPCLWVRLVLCHI